MVFTAFLLSTQHESDSLEKKVQSLFVAFLRKTQTGLLHLQTDGNVEHPIICGCLD